MPSRPRRFRLAILVAGILLVLALGGFLAYRSSWVQSWFGRDVDNSVEMAKLVDAKLAVDPPAATAAGWPQWRGPMRDGRAPAGSFRTDWAANPLKRIWSSPCGSGYSSLAVVADKVYGHDRTGQTERIFCLDITSGKRLWEYAYPADYSGFRMGYATGPRATPTVVGNRIYAVGAVGKFLCLEAPPVGGQPTLLWEHDLLGEFNAAMPGWGVSCSPLVDGGLVIVQPGGKDGAVAAFDALTGQLRWKVGSDAGGYSSPMAATVGGVRIVYALTGAALLCIRAGDGKEMDRYEWKTQHSANIATPIVVDDYIFISSAYNKGCALLRAVGSGDVVKLEEVYARNNRLLRTHHSTAVYRDGFLYGFDGTRSTFLKCVDFRKGIELPAWDERELGSGTLILADRYLIVLTERGQLALIEAKPDAVNVLASVSSGLVGSETWALPVLVDGHLYLRGSNEIICLDVRP